MEVFIIGDSPILYETGNGTAGKRFSTRGPFDMHAQVEEQMAYWFGFAAVAGAFGGLLAFGVGNIHANIGNWRILFIIEGVPAVMLGVLTLFLLPNRPESTTYLTERERQIAVERMNRSTSGDTGAVINRG
ncbi:hypothetical protein C0993_001401 [Termitomyces sp. T159_Od127]|nr:hypothetical protein C0993_001401 [Termitomyces sp. T159_Od127]